MRKLERDLEAEKSRNAELAREVTSLREREEAYRSLVNVSADAIYVMDRDRRIVFINAPGVAMFGLLSEADILGRRSEDFIHPDARPIVAERFKSELSGNADEDFFPHRRIRADGSEFYAEGRATPIMWKGGSAVLVVLRDTNDRKEVVDNYIAAEARSIAAESKLTDAIEAMSEGFALFDAEERLVMFNSRYRDNIWPAVADIVEPGIHFEDIVQATIDRGMWDADAEESERLVNTALERHRNLPSISENPYPDGRWIRQTKRRTSSGGVVAVYADITEIRRREASAAESEERHRRLLETLPDAVVIHSGGKFAYVNPAAVKLLGADSYKDLVGRQSIDLIHPDDRELDTRRKQQVLREGGTLPPVEQRRVQLDGTEIWVETRGTFIVWNGKPAFLGVMRDLTERKHAEEALFEYERRFSAMIANIPGAVYQRVMYPDGRMEYPFITDGVKETHGITAEAAMNDPSLMKSLLHPDTRDSFLATLRHSAEKLSPIDVEVKNTAPDGRDIWVRSAARPWRREDGAIVWDGIFMDINDKKEAEEQAKQAYQWLIDAIECLSDGFVLWDSDDRLLLWNHGFFEVHPDREKLLQVGRSFEELMRAMVDFNHADQSAAERKKQLRNRLEFHRVAKGSYEVTTAAGGCFSLTERRTDEGFTVGIYRDVTEEREYDRRLRDSEERYRTLIDSSPDALYVLRDGEILFVNAATIEMFGARDASELVGLDQTEICDESERATVRQRELRVAEVGGVAPAHQLRQRLDGSTFWASSMGRTIIWEGSPAVLATIRDITEEKRRIQQLSESEETARTLIDAATEFALLIDSDFKILAVNTLLAKGWNTTADDLVGKNILDVAPNAVKRRAQNGWTQAIKTGEELECDIEVGGRLYRDSYYPIVDTGGNVTRLAIFGRDVTEEREAERRLEEAKEEAEFASRSKSEFLANMSHELRTPLNAVIGFSEVMKDEMFGSLGNDAYRSYALDIHESGKHLLQVINDILDLSKVEAGKLVPHPSNVNLSAAIDSSIRILRGRAEEQRIRIETAIAPDMPMLRADERMIKQILMNLLSNAVKFTEPGGRIRVRASSDPVRGVAISVSDNGIGISKNDIERVLAPFGQVDSTLSRRFEGTGLGLPLTQSLAELHGGTLDIRSLLGIGTVVRVTFPVSAVV